MDTSFLYEHRKKSQIMFIGSHHWKNFGADHINLEEQDMFTEKRKKELNDLLTLLRTFEPTKVMIEWPVSKQDVLDKRYSSFRNGEIDIDHNDYLWEGYQIGFRLAKMVGHSKIYGIDNINPEVTNLPIDQVMTFVQDNDLQPYGSVLLQFMSRAKPYVEGITKLPLIEMYRELNSKEGLELNDMVYYIFSEIGEGWNAPGLELSTLWFKRNLEISAIIARRLDFETEERALVIIGQGHVPHLRSNAKRSPYFDVIEYSDLLSQRVE